MAVKAAVEPGGALLVRKGALCSYENRACQVRRLLSPDCVLIEYLDTQDTARVEPFNLKFIQEVENSVVEGGEAAAPVVAPASKSARSQIDLAEISEEDLTDARRRMSIIEPLLQLPDRKRADVEKVAVAYELNTATVYDWMRRFRQGGHLTSLVAGRRGWAPGKSRLTAEQDAVIRNFIDDVYLTDRQPTALEAIEQLSVNFEMAKLDPCSDNTIRNRLHNIPLKTKLSLRGDSDEAKHTYDAAPGQYAEATSPLAVVQIDHLRVDLIFVDPKTRAPIAMRAWMTLAICCFSRMIVGYYLGFDTPGAYGTGVCLYMGIMSKKPLLEKLGVAGRWPVFGLMKKVHCDNAPEFKGAMMQDACDEHAIDLQLRPLGRPRYGAHIENLVGRVAREFHKRKGTTHRKPTVSPDHDPVQHATWTLKELEVDFVDWVVNVYHNRQHNQLDGKTPLQVFEAGIMGDKNSAGSGLRPIPPDHEKLRMDFLPLHKRGVHPDGIYYENETFFNNELGKWVNAPDVKDPTEKRQFVIRIDPTTVRHLFFRHPDEKRYIKVLNADRTVADIGWSELKATRAAIKKSGGNPNSRAEQNRYLMRRRDREDAAEAKTIAARMGGRKKVKSISATPVVKKRNLSHGSEIYAPAAVKQVVAEPPLAVEQEDIFATPITAYR